MDKQTWFVPLDCGIVARVTMDISLLNKIRIVKDMQFTIKPEDIKHETKVFESV